MAIDGLSFPVWAFIMNNKIYTFYKNILRYCYEPDSQFTTLLNSKTGGDLKLILVIVLGAGVFQISHLSFEKFHVISKI